MWLYHVLHTFKCNSILIFVLITYANLITKYNSLYIQTHYRQGRRHKASTKYFHLSHTRNSEISKFYPTRLTNSLSATKIVPTQKHTMH